MFFLSLDLCLKSGNDGGNSIWEKMNNNKLTSMETFWYYLQCLALGAGYFSKIPLKKALSERRLVEMTGPENIWYIIQCIAFGAGYFRKTIYKKALSEMTKK